MQDSCAGPGSGLCKTLSFDAVFTIKRHVFVQFVSLIQDRPLVVYVLCSMQFHPSSIYQKKSVTA